MRQAINNEELDFVVGGCVNLSKSKMKIGFTTLGEGYSLNCSYEDARDLLTSLFSQYDTNEAEFDRIVKDEFMSRGWI